MEVTNAEDVAGWAPGTASPSLVLRDAATNVQRRSRVVGRTGLTPGALLALAYLLFVAICAAFPQLVATHNPLEIGSRILAPPSSQHWLGTDENGRDTYSRIIFGARTALFLGFGSVGLALVGGSILGVMAGLGNRFVENVIMRFVDVGLAFPEMLLALVVIAVTGGGSIANMVLAIGLAGIPSFARLIRAQTMTIRRSSYVEAAAGLGLRRSAVVLRHVLPNAVRPVLVLATIGVGTASIAGAALTFIGLGPPPPNPTWGVMLSEAQDFVGQSIWYSVFPGLAITLLVLSVTVVGRFLQRRPRGLTS
jgi:peptide/nickel transport system permease protein